MKTIVVKVGGAVGATAAQQIRDLHAQGRVVVVHGAGRQISEEMKCRGIPVDFVDGRRVTTPEAMDVVRESLAAVNAEIAAAIGDDALPFPGPILSAIRIPELGLVGRPLPAVPKLILDGLTCAAIPVVAPLAYGPMNVNADEAADALALALSAERLLFLTDVPGVLLEGEVLPELDADEAERLIVEGTFTDGIVPKLLAAARSARRGIRTEIGQTLVTA